MRLLVLLDVGVDVRIPPELNPRGGRVREDRLVWEVDPASARALDLALRLVANRPNSDVTVLHLGPAEHGSFLRRALARGCSRAIRVWDDEAGEAATAGKALILAAAAQAAGYDLVLAGNCGVVGAGGQVGVLAAAHLDVPCMTEVAVAAFAPDPHRLLATRALERGFREKVEIVLPAVITVAAAGQEADAPEIPAQALLAALDQDITVWTLADLGLMAGAVREADRPLERGRTSLRRLRLHPVAPPDPTLPAFDRILGLVRGSVKSREGRVVRRPADEVAQEVFEVLRDEGWLDHLKSGSGAGGSASGAGGPR